MMKKSDALPFSILASCALLLGACSSTTDASESDFRNAIQAYYDGMGKPVCVRAEVRDFPIKVADYQPIVPQLDGLAAAALLSRAATQVEVRSLSLSNTPAETTPGFEYALTPRGQEFLRPHREGYAIDGSYFCFGRVRVEKIVGFTEPGPAFDGTILSRVEHQFMIEDVPGWADMSEMKSAFPEMAELIDGMQTRTLQLKRTGDGWQVLPDRASPSDRL